MRMATKKAKLTPEDVQARLPSNIKLDPSTYKGVHVKARFIDDKYGEFWKYPSDIFNSPQHPEAGWAKTRTCQLLPVEDIIKRIPSNLTLDISTYKNTHTKARFIDAQYGEWWVTPNNLLTHSQEHPARKKEKTKQTNRERYGVDHSLQDPRAREIGRQTNLKKYGTEYATQSQLIKDKTRKTNQQRYGFDSPAQHPEIKAKTQVSMKTISQERYGTDYPIQSQKVRKKLQDAVMAKYGVPNTFLVPEIREKIYQTCMSRYGHKTPLENRKIRNRAIKKWRDSPNRFHSVGEKEIKDFVESLGVGTVSSMFVNHIGESYEIDVKPREIPIGVEYNGDFYHSEKYQPSSYHLSKMRAANANGIRLIQIFEHEWKLRRAQIQSYLRSVFGKNTEILSARDMDLRVIEQDGASKFLESYHIQGPGNFSVAIGLFNGIDLVAVAAFGKHHRDQAKGWVLSRWCCKESVTIRGGLSKISVHALEILNTDRLISWSDNRFSNGSGYLSSGWLLDGELPPDYFYFGSKKPFAGHIIPKQSRRKSVVGTPPGMTEHEHALKDGLLRVYDAGKKRFVFTLPKKT